MTQTLTADELKSLLLFPFQDPDWKSKFILGSLIVLASYALPVVPLIFIYGYIAPVVRRVGVEGKEPFLPEWDNWGKLFADGLKLLGAGLVYFLPVIVIFIAGYGLFFIASLAPTIPAAMEEPGQAATGLLVGLMLVGMLGGGAIFMVGMVLAIVISLFLPVALIHLIVTDDFAAAFRFGELWAIFRMNAAGFLVAYALLIGFSLIIALAIQILFLTVIFCCLYPFLLAPLTLYSSLIWSVLFAQAYRDGAQALKISHE